MCPVLTVMWCRCQVKSYLRRRRGTAPFPAEIARAFAEVSRDNVIAYYEACITQRLE